MIKLSSILIFLLACVFSTQGQSDTSNSKIIILEYGLPPGNDYLNARETVANNWDIKFIPVAECLVSESLKDSIEKNNELSFRLIREKFGNNWQAEFDKEVEIELQYQSQVRNLIDNQEYIITLDSILGSKGNVLFYTLKAKESQKIYSANVWGLDEWEGKNEFVIFYKLIIDLSENAVKIVSDKPQLLKIN